MDYVLTPHARKRMRERKIREETVRNAIANPDRIDYDNNGRMLFKKIYEQNNRERLLLAAAESKNGMLEIITVIDTTKIKKYL